MRAIQRVVNSQASIYQTFPPKTSLASSNMGLWPASARYFAVDKPANPAKVTSEINKASSQLEFPSKFPNSQRKITSVKNINHELHQTCTSNHDLQRFTGAFAVSKKTKRAAQLPNSFIVLSSGGLGKSLQTTCRKRQSIMISQETQ
jgi:hypothetical protein